jgi:tricorn protease
VDPRSDIRKVDVDAWRRYREWFYDPQMHGVDWEALRARYEPMLADCVSRRDLGYEIRELFSELNGGHAYYRGADEEGEVAPTVAVGLLGCDFALEEGAYRITRILTGAPWDVDARGPLGQPGVDVEEGDWLLAVDGVPLDLSGPIISWSWRQRQCPCGYFVVAGDALGAAGALGATGGGLMTVAAIPGCRGETPIAT